MASNYRTKRDNYSKLKKGEEIRTNQIEEAMAKAKADPRVTDVEDAICWIIDHSEYWRKRGHDQIMQDIRDAIAKFNDMEVSHE